VVLRAALESRQVEPVRVPTAADGGMRGGQRVVVPGARLEEDGQTFLAERQDALIEERLCEGRRPVTVTGVDIVVVPAGVVEEREGLDDDRVGLRGAAGEGEPVQADPEPMRRSVDAREVEPWDRRSRVARRSMKVSFAHQTEESMTGIRQSVITLLLPVTCEIATAGAQGSRSRRAPRTADPYDACLKRATTNVEYSDCGVAELARPLPRYQTHKVHKSQQGGSYSDRPS